MQRYIIKKASDPANPFEGVMPVQLAHYHPQGTPGYTPAVLAWLSWDAEGLYLLMRAYEREILATQTAPNSAVYTDSCMEFFFNLAPHTGEQYVNLELNALGTMLMGFGDDAQSQRQRFTPADFAITPALRLGGPAPHWDVALRFPWAEARRFYPSLAPASGMTFRGNFFKCGDGTGAPHYGSWNQVDPAIPVRFHANSSFGILILE